jgi:hypothetical protein
MLKKSLYLKRKKQINVPNFFVLISRVMASINPSRGTRCHKDDNPPKVKVALTKLLNKYQLYKQNLDNDENVDDPDYI